MRVYLAVAAWVVLAAGVCAGDSPRPATEPTTRVSTQPSDSKLLKVLSPVGNVNRIVTDESRLWFATMGGVKMLDRPTNKWRFFTGHDGLASNYITSVSVLDGKVYAFHGVSNQVSTLDAKGDRWDVALLGEKLQRGFWGSPWRYQQVRADGVWCLFTGLPDSEFGLPSAIELQQYDLKTYRLVKSVDVLPLLPKTDQSKSRGMSESPLGLVFVEGNAWIATQEHLVKVDCKTWKTETMPLPAEAVWDQRGKQRLPNTVRSIAAGDKCLWLGLEAGLAKVDPATGKFSFLLVSDEKPYRAISTLVSQGQDLWFSSYNGPICRLDLKTEKVETVVKDAFGWIHQLVILDGEDRVAAGRPDGVSRVALKTGKVTTLRQQEFNMPGNSLECPVLFEDVLCGWDYRRIVRNGKEEMIGGIQTFDLSTGKSAFCEFQEPALMVPQKDRIWLVSYNSVTPFLPLEGKLGKPVGTGPGSLTFSKPPEVVARRDGKLYLLTDSFVTGASGRNPGDYGKQLSVFEPATGKLELVFAVPEEWRSHNALIMGVTSSHVYLTYQDNQSIEHFKRFDLAKKTWEDVDRKGEHNDQVCESLGRVWWGSRDKLQAFKAGNDTPVEQHQLPGHWISKLSGGDDGSLEVVTQAAVLRYDGKAWDARPLLPSGRERVSAGIDRAGKPTGRYAVFSWPGSPEIAIYEGKPDSLRASEKELPVTVDADGTIHVPVPAKSLPASGSQPATPGVGVPALLETPKAAKAAGR